MRRYDIVSAIFLILSIIDFALAAPVLVQEKRQACVDVVHRPKDVITVLGKRGDEELEKLVEDYFNTGEKCRLSRQTSHASIELSAAGARPWVDERGAGANEPNPASSTANGPGLRLELLDEFGGSTSHWHTRAAETRTSVVE
jgi:hypothetical protein